MNSARVSASSKTIPMSVWLRAVDSRAAVACRSRSRLSAFIIRNRNNPVIKAVPPLVTKFIDRAPEVEKDLKELPKEKQLSDFDDKEIGKLAKLMKVDVSVLKEQRDMWKTDMEATDAVAAEAAWLAQGDDVRFMNDVALRLAKSSPG